MIRTPVRNLTRYAAVTMKGHTRVGVRVAIVDPLPVFQHGAAAALAAAGHTVQTPEDVSGWAATGAGDIVVLSVLTDADWASLATLRSAQTQVKVLVLLEDTDTAHGVRAVKSGAVSVLSRRVSPAALCRCVDAVADGTATLPTDVVAVLAAQAGEHDTVVPVSAAKIAWLRALASGTTVAQLAVQAGYSERAMYRLLRALYEDLGVANRVEALILAHARGWLR